MIVLNVSVGVNGFIAINFSWAHELGLTPTLERKEQSSFTGYTQYFKQLIILPGNKNFKIKNYKADAHY